MSKPLVNLNVNPCTMCMPMGSVTAFYGIKGSMSILHGSQGCATYIRRHMATHYNEPVDIASSSLTEQGTVYGGEKNLLKGLENLIKLYDPEVIGVSTTCLAETIGEDTDAIVDKFLKMNPDCHAKIITVATEGYGGSQYEGYFRALHAILSQTLADKTITKATSGIRDSRPLINLVTPVLSPADTRWLKSFLKDMGIRFVLFPDLSDNLDGVTMHNYERLKKQGTSLPEIASMADADLTIEFSEFVDKTSSPAQYLKDHCDIPFHRLPLPSGVRGMDRLIELLEKYGAHVSDECVKERGRYLDAMVDAHKYYGSVRAAVYGEPDFVKSMVHLCCENGIVPVLVATGSACKMLKEAIANEINQVKAIYKIEESQILENCDFEVIEQGCIDLKVQIMIGSSDGRRISHKLGIPLIRCAFPIHDYVGGQRVRTVGFDGSLSLLDQIANAMIARTEATYRQELYHTYYKG
ncbi:nitrogenase component 1 [Sporolactobacillus terrae]|uniref:nitrogenase component 1 n=1 Tax=Sporolactobacillus terrae TaxID=269673 RepID=UPI000490C4D4|nr:nitrogenase component 1 [Sporolactobacillus terrae]